MSPSSVSSPTRARAAAGVLTLLLLRAVSTDAAALESADAATKQTTPAAAVEATTAAIVEATTAATEDVTSAASAAGPPPLPPLPPPIVYPQLPPITLSQSQPVMAPEESLRPVQVKNGDIYSFIIHSKIKYRYAQTVVSSRVANKGNTSNELHFFVTLPESAFISKFLMEVGGKVFEAYVKEKNEAKEEYFTAVKLGQTAAHIEQNARDSNQFTVSVNVESESKVTFNLTYEQLLTRKLGIYENVINLLPGQVVKNLQVIVDIEESSNITTLEVPDIKTVNEIETTTSKNKLAQISRESGNKATITWNPTPTEQLTFTELGVKGQFIVQYDVDHKSTPNQVLIDDGYFVHFFAPTDLKPLRTHVIFVLDVSGSMVGQKLPQLKEAMEQILSEIHPDDFFTLILFSDYAQIWTINATQQTYTRWDAMGSVVKANSSSIALGEQRYVFPATEQNVQYAKKFIQDLVSEGSTNMEDALAQAYDIAKLGKIRFESGPNTPKPIILFLTDGEPTFGITDPQELVKYVSNINVEKYPIFSLGFGDGADIDFLKKLSLNNTGFARVIYEASDASLQLRNFYKEISSPVLSNVTFQYVDTQVDNITVTKKSFNLLFKGTELVVAGRLKDPKSELNSTLDADSTDGKFLGPIIVTCFDYPISPPEDVPQTKKIGHLEKLWAYLYIQQLMDQYELNKNENSTEKVKALELALKYSFVTPLTSLVVVKPNDTKTSADPEKIKPLDNKYNYDSFIMSGNPGLFQSGSAPLANSAAASSYIHPVSLKLGVPGPPSIMHAMKPIATLQYAAIETADFASTTHAMDILHSMTLHSIDELTWLNISNNTEPSITLNTTNSVYQVSLNTTGQSYQNCTTSPNFAEGTCKHLKDCIVDSILNSFEKYIPLFCAINNIYAGICCPV